MPLDNPYSTLRIGLQDKILNITPLIFAWFSDAFSHSLDTHVIFQHKVEYIFLHSFIQTTITLLIKLFRRISINYNPKQNIFGSIAHGFFIVLTVKMVNDMKLLTTKDLKLQLKVSNLFICHT